MLLRARWVCVQLVLLLSACSASETSVGSPSATKCTLSARLSQATFASTGGTGTIDVAGDRDCVWSATTESSWLVIEGRTSGQGEAQVAFRVAENASAAGRQGTVSIESTRVQITQEGAPCRFTVAPVDLSTGVSGGTVAIRISALAGCQWTAQPRDGWITPTPASGNGTGTVTITIAPNAGNSRTGTIVIGGQPVVIRQASAEAPTPAPPAAPGPTPTPTPTPTPVPNPPQPEPTPQPEPPPPPPDRSTAIELSGLLSSLRGACPDMVMMLDGYTVTMDALTTYRRGNCGHLEDGMRIDVEGRASADRRVAATRVTLHR